MASPGLDVLQRVTERVEQLHASARGHEQSCSELIERVHPQHRDGARNLVHYLAVRQCDVRDLQRELTSLGLSSLGRMERCAVASLEAVLDALDALARRQTPRAQGTPPPTSFYTGNRLLEAHTLALLGPARPERSTRVMVTVPVSAPTALLRGLVESGMDIMRINCAKGTVVEWTDLVGRLRQVERELGGSCKVLCDIAGPNPRIFEIDGKRRIRLDPDALPARLWLAKDVKQLRRQLERSKPPVIGCTMPDVVDALRPGHRVFYDDGKLGGAVELVENDAALVRVDYVQGGSTRLKTGKGLNFPDTELAIGALTDKDLLALDFICAHADLLGLSFVRTPADVELAQEELAKRGATDLGLMLKIETTAAFRHFPRVLLTAMRSPNVGVMLARGDMAVEMGFVRLAEVQEELLWLCEAGLVPTIWATQVLESLNKTGVPTRAEVTDAAMSSRAECVMINQGPNVIETVRFVCEILERMELHQDKKRSLMRPLSISHLA